ACAEHDEVPVHQTGEARIVGDDGARHGSSIDLPQKITGFEPPSSAVTCAKSCLGASSSSLGCAAFRLLRQTLALEQFQGAQAEAAGIVNLRARERRDLRRDRRAVGDLVGDAVDELQSLVSELDQEALEIVGIR